MCEKTACWLGDWQAAVVVGFGFLLVFIACRTCMTLYCAAYKPQTFNLQTSMSLPSNGVKLEKPFEHASCVRCREAHRGRIFKDCFARVLQFVTHCHCCMSLLHVDIASTIHTQHPQPRL